MERTIFEIKQDIKAWVLVGSNCPEFNTLLDELDKTAFHNGYEAGRKQGQEDIRNRVNDLFRV